MDKVTRHFFETRERKRKTREPELSRLSRALLVNLLFYERDERNNHLYGWKKMSDIKKTNNSFIDKKGTNHTYEPFYFSSQFENSYPKFKELEELGLILISEMQYKDKRKNDRVAKFFKIAVPPKQLYFLFLSIMDDYVLESGFSLEVLSEKLKSSTHYLRHEAIILKSEEQYIKEYRDIMAIHVKGEYAATISKLSYLQRQLEVLGEAPRTKIQTNKILAEILQELENTGGTQEQVH